MQNKKRSPKLVGGLERICCHQGPGCSKLPWSWLSTKPPFCQLFSTNGPVTALKYGKLFRQAGRQQHVPRTTALKEDLLVWCTCPFGPSSRPPTPFPHQGAPALSRVATADSSSHSSKASAGEEVCHHFNAGRCHRTDCYYLHKCSITGCGGPTLPAPVPTFLHMNCNEL